MAHGPGDYQHRLYPSLRRMDDGRPVIPLDEGLAGWRCTRGYVADVAGAIALAATDERAAGRVYNVGEEAALTAAEWVRAVGEAAGWRGEVVTVPAGRLPTPGDMGQDLVTDTTRIRRELGYPESGLPADCLLQAVAWERANPPAEPPALDYPAEDRLLRGLGR
jgi:nucleoside-diphosphate-sugar epimerase